MSDIALIVSGGLDSVTLTYRALKEGFTPHLLSFNYGQRHLKELAFARNTADRLGLKHDIIDLSGLTHLISNSALTSRVSDGYDTHGELSTDIPEIEVPEGHYAEDSMKATVVPNRNMIMLSIAAGIAVNGSYKGVGTGVHGGDHFIYPDCRPEFISAANAAIVRGNSGFGSIKEYDPATEAQQFVWAPYMHATKEDIAYEALALGVPLHLTWSCYKGGEMHCGKCGTCVERLEAIAGATKRWDEANNNHPNNMDNYDETWYEDSEFWKTAVKK
jgi:7-cyano-7-deazaguanine synthase